MSTINLQTSEAIASRRLLIAQALVDKEFHIQPEIGIRYGKAARAKFIQDAQFHLSYLTEAIAADNMALFGDFIAWAKVVFAKRGISSGNLAVHLQCMKEVLREFIPATLAEVASEFIDIGLEQLPDFPEDVPSFLDDATPLGVLAASYMQALLKGEMRAASKLVLDAVGGGIPVKDIYLGVFQRTQYEIGRLWQTNQISVAEEHYCAAATQLIMSLLYPRVLSSVRGTHTLVAACVSGDLHEIGVRMVADFFEMDGWNTFYLGANMPVASILEILHERKPDVLGVSATLTYHVKAVESLISAVRNDPMLDGVKILVGGYPFNLASNLWKKVGADGYGRDAQEALAVAKRLITESFSYGTTHN